MTQFNLADELRRGGTGLLAQAVAELVKDELAGDVIDMIEFLAEMERRAAAVPAGNQAKAPTALDEMRALQEGAQREASQCSAPMNDRIREAVKVWEKLSPAETVTAWYEVDAMTHGEAVAHFRLKLEKVSEELRFETDLHHKAVAHSFRMSADNCRLTDGLRAQLDESRESLARVEGERDELRRVEADSKQCHARNDEMVSEHLKLRAELRKRDAVIEAARYVVRLHHHPSGQQAAENAFASLMFRLDELEDQAASEAEVPPGCRAQADKDGDWFNCLRHAAHAGSCLFAFEVRPASDPEATESATKEAT